MACIGLHVSVKRAPLVSIFMAINLCIFIKTMTMVMMITMMMMMMMIMIKRSFQKHRVDVSQYPEADLDMSTDQGSHKKAVPQTGTFSGL